MPIFDIFYCAVLPLKCHTKTVRKIEAFWQKLQLFFNCKNLLHFTISRVFKDILYVLNNFLCSFSSFCDEFVCFPRFWWSENDFRKITKKSKIWIYALNLTIIQKFLLNKVLLVVIHQNLKIVLTFWICVPFALFSMLLFIQG